MGGRVADLRCFGHLGHRGVDPRFCNPTATFDEHKVGAQLRWPVGQPLVKEFLQLWVQRDIAVVVKLAQWHAEPVGGADLHDGVHRQVQELTFAHAGAREKLDSQSDERVIVTSSGSE
jgi:hypothetical protein